MIPEAEEGLFCCVEDLGRRAELNDNSLQGRNKGELIKFYE